MAKQRSTVENFAGGSKLINHPDGTFTIVETKIHKPLSESEAKALRAQKSKKQK